MAKPRRTLITIIVPCYNEAANILPFYKALKPIIDDSPYDYELLYVNDGSRDRTLPKLHRLAARDKRVKVLNLSRNFGKEIAMTAGIYHGSGAALLMIAADGQHPVELIPEFIAKWEAGAQVVIGVRKSNMNEGFIKRYGSKLFYALFNTSSSAKLVPGSTDFRLIDKHVQTEFIRMTERSRVTRGLIDWLGFKQDFIYFDANARMAGEAGYSLTKLVGLALNSFISLSLKPLYFAIYAGAVILPLSLLLAAFCVIEMLVGDPLHLNITGSAYLVLLALFLIGLVLISQGITALYLSHIHTETKNRPLFIIDKSSSII